MELLELKGFDSILICNLYGKWFINKNI
jgi:hypothetical protein